MRLFIIGESRFGAAFLRAALAVGHEITAASVTGPLGPRDPLETAARAAGIPLYDAAPITDGWAAPIRRSGAELLALANVSVVLPRDVITACPRGALCFHPSLLPKYRGKHAVREAITAGETHTGVSVFWPDDGADTGPLLLQVRCGIATGDTPHSLYHDKLIPVGVCALLTAVATVESGCAPRVDQPTFRQAMGLPDDVP